MQRVIAHYPTREAAILGALEMVLCFGAIYAMATLAGGPATLPGLIDTFPHDGLALAATLSVVTGATGLTIGLYRVDLYFDRRRLFVTAALVAAVAFAILLAVSGESRAGFSAAQAWFLAKMLSTWLGTMTLIRLGYGLTARRKTLARRVLLVGDSRQSQAFHARLRSHRGRNFDLVGSHEAPVISWSGLRDGRIWAIVVASDPGGAAMAPLLDCKLRGVRIFSAAAFHERYLGRIDLDGLTANDLLLAPGFAASRAGDMVKRLSDLIFSLMLLSLMLPLMVLTALAIKIDSRGPVFYRQQRIGQFAKPFTVLKFRSMAIDAEAGGSPRWAQRHDPRITRVGRFIRATRIDELPQLANVIRGEMSLVGPRPERPHFVEQLTRAIPFYRQRAYVKPGVTGWAQINFPYGASVEDAREKLAYDLYYVKNRSLLLDAVILVSTVRVVLFREGAR
jgi:exopolysaccharide biosynthesis polyprenyl glycosylphosphotransferase